MRKYILIAISGLILSHANAQTNGVFYDGDDLYSAGGTSSIQVIATDFAGGYFKPAFGSLIANLNPFLVATNTDVSANGNIVSGSVTNTWELDSDYLQVDGANTWTNFFYFTNSTECPRLVTFHGRYDGLASHTIKFKAYDFTNSVYSNFTANADDLEASTIDSTVQFTFPAPEVNYCDTNGATWVAIEKVGVADRDLYTDFIQLTYATAVATNAGVWYDLADFPVGQSNNITIDADNATFTTIDAGEYEWTWYLSFTGESNTEFHVRNLTNGVATHTESIRTIGSQPQVGSMSAFGGGRLPAGATNSYQFKASTDDAWISIVTGAAKMKKEAN